MSHLLKLAGKFIVRGFVFKAGKKAALRGGRPGIAAGALIAGGFLAYQLLEERKKRKKKKTQKKLANKDEPIVV